MKTRISTICAVAVALLLGSAEAPASDTVVKAPDGRQLVILQPDINEYIEQARDAPATARMDVYSKNGKQTYSSVLVSVRGCWNAGPMFIAYGTEPKESYGWSPKGRTVNDLVATSVCEFHTYEGSRIGPYNNAANSARFRATLMGMRPTPTEPLPESTLRALRPDPAPKVVLDLPTRIELKVTTRDDTPPGSPSRR